MLDYYLLKANNVIVTQIPQQEVKNLTKMLRLLKKFQKRYKDFRKLCSMRLYAKPKLFSLEDANK